MDIQRDDLAKAKKRRRLIIGTVVVIVILTASVGISQLEPGAPSVNRATVWIGTVERGPMLREVRGTGSLVPEEMRWIPAATDGRVERILVQPGEHVDADTVLMELSDPGLVQGSLEAGWRTRSAESEYEGLKARLEGQRLEQEATLARIRAEAEQARLRARADEELAKEGLLGELPRKLSSATADELERRAEFESRRLDALKESVRAQLASQRSNVEQLRSIEEFKRERRESLEVRSGISGVLLQVAVEVGQRVTPGTILAKIVDPTRLKAELRVAETQARDLQVGQRAVVDTRNAKVEGQVSRIDPAAQGGTVRVDISLEGELPRGARPDLTVDGTIELERLDDVLHLGRPVYASDHSTIGLFRVVDGTAHRVSVRVGRTSVITIEIIEGLGEGDEVILSDMSAWDDYDRIRLE
jgi:HlyD family secretion protein